MGLFRRDNVNLDELAEKVAAELVKASAPGLGRLPAGTTTTALAPLPVENQAGVGFGPGIPLPVRPIDPREPGRAQPEPRTTQFPVSVNTQLADRMVPFQTLRDVADQVDVIRRCIEVRKAQILSLEWSVNISRRTLKQIIADDAGATSPGEAAQIARERYATDIAKAEAFWERPDPVNGLDFFAWLAMLLEEMFVTDAVTIYPRVNRRGDFLAFELLDGTTIKPLLDHRGATPQPPYPAYQQVLYGFPRGEFTASVDPAAEYQYDSLIYRPRNRRTFTPYGYSNVEQACSVADLYLKRADWMRKQFTHGVLPAGFMKTTGTAKMTPDDLKVWEDVFNDEMSGQTGERQTIRLLPEGFDPVTLDEWAKKYNPEFDEFLIKLMCACFDVMPTEIGFAPKSGIGGKGHQEGEENTTYRKAIRPTVTWLAGIINEVSRTYLGMPSELEFEFLGFEVEDQLEMVQMHDQQVRGGVATINEIRSEQGRALWDFPEADTPFIVTGAGLQFLPAALQAIAVTAVEGDPNAGVASEPEAIAAPHPPTPPVGEEIAKFVRYARKRKGAWRDFDFENPALAEFSDHLNAWGEQGELDKIASWAQADLQMADPAPPPVINVDARTYVRAEPPNVEVDARPTVNVPEQPAPTVQVEAPVVNVAPVEVKMTAPETRKVVRTVERDKDGLITKVVED